MKQSSSEHRPSRILFALTLIMSLSTAHAQQVSTVDPIVSSDTSGFVPSDAAIDPALVQSGALGVANNVQNQALQSQQAALLAQQQQAALIAQQQAANTPVPQNNGINTGQLIALCGNALSGLSGGMNNQGKRASQQILEATTDYNSTAGYTTEKAWKPETAAEVGTNMSKNFAQGCSQFINKKGDLGPWGRTALANIRENADSFGTEEGSKYPRDLNTICPKYGSLDKTKRELFWVWTLAAMAEHESSCRTTKDTNVKAAYGTAYGIFQLEYKNNRCPGASNLNDPDQNISCAVRQLSKELDVRPTLRSSCSATCPRTGTYWGTLRSDTNNNSSAMKAADNKGSVKTLARIKQYQYCN